MIPVFDLFMHITASGSEQCYLRNIKIIMGFQLL